MLKIICVGKLGEKFYTEAAAEYAKRLGGYCALEVSELREQRLPASPSEAQIEAALFKERAMIESAIPKGAAVIAMCVEGRELSSRELSELVRGYGERGISRLCFIVGGSFGLHQSVKNMADVRLSMSKMTFPHSLARVMLLEQLYRCFKIAEGGKYHK